MRAGTSDQFYKRFEPIEVREGEIMREWSELPVAISGGYIWTVLDCDGKLYVAPGFHFVNRMGYVLCGKPWGTNDAHRDYVY